MAVTMIEVGSEKSAEPSLCKLIALKPRAANEFFLAMFIATYTTYLRVTLKIPREALTEFKGSIGEHFLGAISDSANPVTDETLKTLSWVITGLSIALEDDIFDVKDVDRDVVDVRGQIATNLLIDSLKRTYISNSPEAVVLGAIELLRLQNLFEDAPLDLMVGLKKTAELRFE